MPQNVLKVEENDCGFGQNPEFYHQNAGVQKEVAKRLISSLKPWREILPAGPILELGCGTGFLSEGLSKLFPKRELIFSDASTEMLGACKKNIKEAQHINFKHLNGEDIPVDKPTYAMTTSSFVAQWFRHPAYTLARWLEVTNPGGLLLAAYPGNNSFPEWKKYAEELGLPFTANKLPETEEMVVKLSSDISQVDYYEDTIYQDFSNAKDFFRHLKNVGAGKQLKGRHLTAQEMKLLIRHWNEKRYGNITVSWHVVFLAVKKI